MHTVIKYQQHMQLTHVATLPHMVCIKTPIIKLLCWAKLAYITLVRPAVNNRIDTPYGQTTLFCFSQLETIGVDSGGSPGTRPPIIRMGAKPLFCPLNNQTRILRKN